MCKRLQEGTDSVLTHISVQVNSPHQTLNVIPIANSSQHHEQEKFGSTPRMHDLYPRVHPRVSVH